jgi:hypothetical protein
MCLIYCYKIIYYGLVMMNALGFYLAQEFLTYILGGGFAAPI